MIPRDSKSAIPFTCAQQGCAELAVIGGLCLPHYKTRPPEIFTEPAKKKKPRKSRTEQDNEDF